MNAHTEALECSSHPATTCHPLLADVPGPHLGSCQFLGIGEEAGPSHLLVRAREGTEG